MNTSSLILGIIALFGALFYVSIFIYGLFDPLSPLAVESLFEMLFLVIATSCGWLAIFLGLVSITKKKNPGFKKGVVGAVLGFVFLQPKRLPRPRQNTVSCKHPGRLISWVFINRPFLAGLIN